MGERAGEKRGETGRGGGTHIEDLALLGRSDLERDVDVPAALVVEDVGTNLSYDGAVAVAIEDVVLDLEVLSERDEDVESCGVRFRVLDARHVHREGDGEVEGVVGRLVDDN